MNYGNCWMSTATALFAQALAGEPVLAESLPKPLPGGSFGFCATIGGAQQGRFTVLLDGTLLDASLVGDGMDQKAGWAELLREVAEAAAGDLLARTGQACRVERFEPAEDQSQVTAAFQLRTANSSWTILVRDEVRVPRAEPRAAPAAAQRVAEPQPLPDEAAALPGVSPGVELLLDVELEATLRFGCREMLLGELLELGPGDVVQLDRHITDPVDLLVGDKIVAHGEVVLVNGNFGLRVLEVAAPRKRLESIRCLF